MVNADAAQVAQALMSLCINAKEAIPGDGKLTTETKNENVDQADCRLQVTARLGPNVLVEITDTRGGIDAEMLGRVLDPFFTTKGWGFPSIKASSNNMEGGSCARANRAREPPQVPTNCW